MSPYPDQLSPSLSLSANRVRHFLYEFVPHGPKAEKDEMRVGTEVLVAKRRRKEEYARDDRVLFSRSTRVGVTKITKQRQSTFIFLFVRGNR